MADFAEYFSDVWALLQDADLFRPGANATFRNPALEGATYRVLILRLSPFRDVSRSNPHLFLAQAARRAVPGAFIDMAFFPPEHDRERFLADGIPLIIGTQSFRSVQDFDLVLISNSYTLELINLPYLLSNSGVPLMASQRSDEWPALILGGSNALVTQSVMTPDGDCVADGVFFGEGEREVESLVTVFAGTRSQEKAGQLLAAAERISALWVANQPSQPSVRKAVCRTPTAPDLLSAYPSLNSDEADTARLQISFGCPAFCSFCFEGYDRKPYRELSVEQLLSVAEALKRQQGVEAIDVYSFNFNTHSEILELLLELNWRFERVNLTSQRVDLLAVMPSLMEAEVAADKRSYTLGIEGVSARKRAFFHKSLTDQQLDALLNRLIRQAIRDVKLFFILTGHETEDDLADFHDLVLKIKAWRKQHNRGLRVVFSFGYLVRMPFTPLQYDRLYLEEDAWRQITGTVKSSCETNGFEFRLATDWEEYAASQVLALGGTWLHEPVLTLAGQGHHYDLRLTPGYWASLRRWMDAAGYWDEEFLGEKDRDYPWPLAFVNGNIPSAYLHGQYQEAVAGNDRGYCLGEVGDPGNLGEPGSCLGCGACATPAERAEITQHAMRYPTPDYLSVLERTMRSKWRLQPVYARLRLPPAAAGGAPAWVNALLMRAFLEAFPTLEDNLLSVNESVFQTRANRARYAGTYGETIVALRAWDLELLEAALMEGQELPDGVQFQGWVAGFEPGGFVRARFRIDLPADHFPDAGRALRRYLQAQYVPVNLRGADHGYVYDIPDKALKKRVLLAGAFAEIRGRYHLDLVATPKLNLVDLLSSFTEPGRFREARVEVSELVI
jgi:radical SAM superfamily enzyme YgiQ (UPF0313 family)